MQSRRELRGSSFFAFLPPSLPENWVRPPRGAVVRASLTGASPPALRLPVRAAGLSMALVGGSGCFLSGSSSGSLPSESCEMKFADAVAGLQQVRVTQELVEVLRAGAS